MKIILSIIIVTTISFSSLYAFAGINLLEEQMAEVERIFRRADNQIIDRGAIIDQYKFRIDYNPAAKNTFVDRVGSGHSINYVYMYDTNSVRIHNERFRTHHSPQGSWLENQSVNQKSSRRVERYAFKLHDLENRIYLKKPEKHKPPKPGANIRDIIESVNPSPFEWLIPAAIILDCNNIDAPGNRDGCVKERIGFGDRGISSAPYSRSSVTLPFNDIEDAVQLKRVLEKAIEISKQYRRLQKIDGIPVTISTELFDTNFQLSGQLEIDRIIKIEDGNAFISFNISFKLHNLKGLIDSKIRPLVPPSGCDIWRFNNDLSLRNEDKNVVAGASATYEERTCYKYPCFKGWKIYSCYGWTRLFTHVHNVDFKIIPITKLYQNKLTMGAVQRLEIEWANPKIYKNAIKEIDLNKMPLDIGIRIDKEFQIWTDGHNLFGTTSISTNRPVKVSMANLISERISEELKDAFK